MTRNLSQGVTTRELCVCQIRQNDLHVYTLSLPRFVTGGLFGYKYTHHHYLHPLKTNTSRRPVFNSNGRSRGIPVSFLVSAIADRCNSNTTLRTCTDQEPLWPLRHSTVKIEVTKHYRIVNVHNQVRTERPVTTSYQRRLKLYLIQSLLFLCSVQHISVKGRKT